MFISLALCTGLLRLQDLVRSPPTSKMEVYIRQATVKNYRDVLREIKQRDITNFIVDTRTEHVQSFFRAVSPAPRLNANVLHFVDCRARMVSGGRLTQSHRASLFVFGRHKSAGVRPPEPESWSREKKERSSL